MKIKKTRLRSASASLMIAISQIVGGGAIGIIGSVSYVIARAVENIASSQAIASRFCLFLLFASAAVIVRGIMNCVLYGKYRKLSAAVIAKNGAVTLQQAADETSSSPAKVLADIGATLDHHYWSGYGLTENTLVLVDSANNSGTILLAQDMVFKETRRRSRGCLWWFAAVWAFAFAFRLASPWYGNVAVTVASIAVLALTAHILPRKTAIEQRPLKTQPEPIPEPVKTGVEETDGLLSEGMKHLKELAAIGKTISDSKLGKPVGELSDIARQIFSHIEKAPEKSRQIRQFVNYYLPTTIRLLKNYDELNRQMVKGENISEAIAKIEGIMDGILFTFRRQLDDLYRDKNIDISADISVMENMISQDDILSSR